MALLPQPLTTFEYYVRKCPLYLQNSSGFLSHFRFWYDYVMYNIYQPDFGGVLYTEENFLRLLDIFADDYLDVLDSFRRTQDTDFLDKLASLFGISRVLTITYFEDTQYKTSSVKLTDSELLIFIKCQIIRNYCDGTYEQLKKYYASTGLIVQLSTSTDSATVDVYLIALTDDQYSDNIKHLFLSGLLTVKSVGIQYRHSVIMIENILIWDEGKWDEGEWII